MSLTHFKNKNKDVEMVDISKKNKSSRIAEAESFIKISHDLYKIFVRR
jgi:molybdenum cofactor biosynthesis enzyme